MQKQLTYDFQIQTKELGDSVLKISGYASTTTIDRHSDIIKATEWNEATLANFKKNPVLLFNHNYDNVIGGVTNLSVDERGLKIEAEIDKSWPMWEAVDRGRIKTFSVGFYADDYDYDTEHGVWDVAVKDLLEISVVTVPSNPDAIFSLAKQLKDDKNLHTIKMKKIIETLKGLLSKGALTDEEKTELASLIKQAGEVLEPAPADEAPADEAPADEAPADEAPADEAPADEAPEPITNSADSPELVKLRAELAQKTLAEKQLLEKIAVLKAGGTVPEGGADPDISGATKDANPIHQKMADEANAIYRKNKN